MRGRVPPKPPSHFARASLTCVQASLTCVQRPRLAGICPHIKLVFPPLFQDTSREVHIREYSHISTWAILTVFPADLSINPYPGFFPHINFDPKLPFQVFSGLAPYVGYFPHIDLVIFPTSLAIPRPTSYPGNFPHIDQLSFSILLPPNHFRDFSRISKLSHF
jgi:hypothetical protein